MTDRARIALAEAVGTAVLVIGGCGSAVLAGSAIGAQGVAIAFGLSLLVMAYTIGGISGCHINPAVTVGLAVLGKVKRELVPVYLVAQFVGGIVGGAVIYLIASGLDSFDMGSLGAGGFATNGWGADGSPAGYGFLSMAVVEIVLTALFVLAVAATTRRSMPTALTGVSVGLMLTLVHLISIPVDNTSVNPARSFGVAIFRLDTAISQVWAFIVFPVIGAVLGASLWKALVPADDAGAPA